jgi:hypothetical protein
MNKDLDPEKMLDLEQTPSDGYECGVATVGAKAEPQGCKQLQVTFTQPFAAPPCVVTNALEVGQNDYPDSFVVTLANVTAMGFTARIRRIDTQEQTWGQPLQLSWIAAGHR